MNENKLKTNYSTDHNGIYELFVTEQQCDFIEATEDEILFGGAAGGGKSHGQMVDALVYALKYPGSRQLVLRRTMPELEMTLIRTANRIFPRDLWEYSPAKRQGRFANGSTLDFGFCDSPEDAMRYQSAEYDLIRFDELTHFPERSYLYLMSRLRGANDFPKAMKSTTNPGGPGHSWVKKRFIDAGIANRKIVTKNGTRRFIPAFAKDNLFLMQSDKAYLKRLENLPEIEKKALLLGDWDINAGRFFGEWSRGIHVEDDFKIPADWRRYAGIDYGMDMLAVVFCAVTPTGEITNPNELGKVGSKIAVRDMAAGDVGRMVAYLQPAQINPMAYSLVGDIVTRSRELAGASDAATGEIDPEKASGTAIIAVREAARIQLSGPMAAYKNFVEQCGEILLELWRAYHPNGVVTAEGRFLPPEVIGQVRLDVTVEVTPATAFDRYAEERAMENLFSSGVISFEEYVASLERDSAAPRRKLREILAKRAANAGFVSENILEV